MGTKIPSRSSGAADPGARVAVASGVIDFTGLSGTGGYRVEAKFLIPTGADNDYIIQLNGVTSGYSTSMSWVSGPTGGFGSNVGNFGGGSNTNGFSFARAGLNSNRDGIWTAFEVSPANGTDMVLVSGRATTFASATGAQAAPSAILFTGNFTSALNAPITEIKLLRADGSSSGITSGFGRIQQTGFTA